MRGVRVHSRLGGSILGLGCDAADLDEAKAHLVKRLDSLGVVVTAWSRRFRVEDPGVWVQGFGFWGFEREGGKEA